jgi:hypothetical protein
MELDGAGARPPLHGVCAYCLEAVPPLSSFGVWPSCGHPVHALCAFKAMSVQDRGFIYLGAASGKIPPLRCGSCRSEDYLCEEEVRKLKTTAVKEYAAQRAQNLASGSREHPDAKQATLMAHLAHLDMAAVSFRARIAEQRRGESGARFSSAGNRITSGSLKLFCQSLCDLWLQ